MINYSNNSVVIQYLASASNHTVDRIDIRRSELEVLRLIDTDQAGDILTTFNLYGNILKYNQIDLGTGAITNFNHGGNTITDFSVIGAGHRLYSSGTATLSGTTTAITHNLFGGIPDSAKLSLIPFGSLGVSSMWAQDFTATNFDVLTDSTSTIKVGWKLDE